MFFFFFEKYSFALQMGQESFNHLNFNVSIEYPNLFQDTERKQPNLWNSYVTLIPMAITLLKLDYAWNL